MITHLPFPMIANTDPAGLLAMALGLTFALTIVCITFYSQNRRLKLTHETVRLMIEKGQQVTPEMVAALKMGQPTRNARATKDLRVGVVLVAVGAGLLMVVGRPGWIVLLMGSAFLVLWILNMIGGKETDKRTDNPTQLQP